jgi:hypothetical protein
VAVSVSTRVAVRGVISDGGSQVKGTAFTCCEDATQIGRGEIPGSVDRHNGDKFNKSLQLSPKVHN